MGWDRSLVPDPQDPETFPRSKLRWDERGDGMHARILALYRDLIALRRRVPDLTDPAFAAVRAEADETARAFRLQRGGTEILVNFADAPADASGAVAARASCSRRTRRPQWMAQDAPLTGRSALVIGA